MSTHYLLWRPRFLMYKQIMNQKSTEQTPLFSTNLCATGCHPIKIARPYSFASPDFSRLCPIKYSPWLIIIVLSYIVNPFKRSCTISPFVLYFQSFQKKLWCSTRALCTELSRALLE